MVLVAGACVGVSPTSALDLSKLPPPAAHKIDFGKEIQPILENACLKCHGNDKPKGRFMLDTREHALKGGNGGPAIISGSSADSPLIHFVARLVEDSEMPPDGKGEPLTPEQIGLLRAWIDQGVNWPSQMVLRASHPPQPTTQNPQPAAALPPPATRQVDFVKDIQPIFSKHCYSCHGPQKQEAEFRLDAKEIAFKGGELGPAIVPGNSAESLLIHAVAGTKPDLTMPMKGERLTAAQVGVLRAWIDQGAVWPDSASVKIQDKRDHWAFKPPIRPAVPDPKNTKWPHNPIDHFVLARLDGEKLKPSREADRVTLIRRLSLDLTGLPPTLREVDEFLADRAPDAYERLVERMLASPHYGERWARVWLDLARYADTNGYEKDKPRSIWPYRDWVINALNRDLPFDQFAIEQLAGDLLPDATREQRIATGFLRNSMMNQEGGIEPEQFRVEALIDRIDTVGKAFLGLTIACAQCHNHKYDPISQKEYYQLYAFLNNDDEAFLEVPAPEHEKRRASIHAKVRALEAAAMKATTNLAEQMAEWEKSITNPTREWVTLDPIEWQNFATKFEKQEDGSLLGGGDLQPGGVMRVWADTQLTNITGLRLDALTDPNLIYGGPGVLGKGSFIVKEFTVEAYARHEPAVTNQIKFRRAEANLEAAGFSITNAIDGKTDVGGWTPATTPERRNEDHHAVFECDEPFGFPGGTRMLITIHQLFKPEEKNRDTDKDTKLECHMLGRLRLSVTTGSGPLKADPLTPAQRKLLAVPAAERTPRQQQELFSVFRRSSSAFAELNKKIDQAFADWPYPPTTMVLQERPASRKTHVFRRGDPQRPGELVQADVPSVLHDFPENAPRNRLGFARWIVDRRSPTTARVIVNQLWQAYFGEGLVSTPEDFGTRVETPSHPELLDWLAVELMEPSLVELSNRSSVEPAGNGNGNGNDSMDPSFNVSTLPPWSLKHIHRLIVTSATYRQSSRITPELYEKDQYNRLLARAPRLRVEGEAVQDIALAVSGLLNSKIGGPSVYPPIPESVGDTVYGGFRWPESKGEDRYRRGLYTFAKRSLPFPTLAAFDAPSGEFSCPRRPRSNTPLQALTTLNEKTYVEAAQAMALRVMKEGGPNEKARAAYAFRLATGRKPTSAEAGRLLQFWREHYAHFENQTAAAVKVAVPDINAMPEDVNLHKAAAWAMVARVILNLDETITKE